MKNWLFVTFVMAGMVITGCCKDDGSEDCNWIRNAKYNAEMKTPRDFNHVASVSYNKADWMFEGWLKKHKSDYLKYRNEGCSDDVGFHPLSGIDSYRSACLKREMALLMGRCGYTYTFKSYFNLDGASGIIYNTAYVFSIPRKILTGMLTAEGVIEYLCNATKLLIGGVFAIVGIPCSFVINTICHPLETLANLTVGVAYFGDGWGTYVANTNLIVTLWDLIWGAILYPLFQAFIFFV